MSEIYDVLILGAGVSGIGMGCRLASEQPNKRFAILEQKTEIGGTWSTFRYPGVRSDSDMFTYGYKFKPWREYKTLADGTSIRSYLGDAAQEYAIADKIHYGQHCHSANWDDEKQLWTVTATQQPDGQTRQWQARFIVSCQGYYNHEQGYTPEFAGADSFNGQIIHPQQWPENLDYKDKNIVVIGSGATAVTLIPSLAETANQVTMLQRSPTYIFSLPGIDHMTKLMSRVLPKSWTFAIARKRNLELWQTTYKICKRFPSLMRRLFVGLVKRHLGSSYSDQDFNPQYDPWDQRLCAVPDADLFKAIREQRAQVVTDHIDSFTPTGIQLKSGQHLDADIIITATGLSVQMFGGMNITIDNQAYDLPNKMVYKSVLLEDLPNFAWIFGYINLSWTMKADMSSLYLCRLLAHMDEQGWGQITPRDRENSVLNTSVLDQLTAGYVVRARSLLPRQGNKMPWIVRHNYREDKKMMLKQPIADTALEGLPRKPHLVSDSTQPERSKAA